MSLGALAGSQSLGVGPYQEGKSAGFLQLPCLQGHQTAGRPRLGIGKTEDLGLRREKREQPCSRWVPSGSRQWNISPLIIISKREERRWVSWLSLFNYFFPLGRQSHNEGEAGQGPDKGSRVLCQSRPGTVGLARHLLAAPGSRDRNLQGKDQEDSEMPAFVRRKLGM